MAFVTGSDTLTSPKRCSSCDRSFCTIAAFAQLSTAHSGSAPTQPTLQSLAPADLDAFITRTVADQHAIGVTVGVMQDGKVIFSKGYGLANTSHKTPVTTDTLFAVGSVTKQFTCAVALQLEQEGKL